MLDMDGGDKKGVAFGQRETPSRCVTTSHCHATCDIRTHDSYCILYLSPNDDKPRPFLPPEAPARLSLGIWKLGPISSLELELSSSSSPSSLASNRSCSLTLGVSLKCRDRVFDLEKSPPLLVRSVSRLNWELLPGIDLVGVFIRSKEVVISDSFSDSEGDGDGSLGTWLLPGMKSGGVLPFFLRGGTKTRPVSKGIFFSAPDVLWDNILKGPWLLVRGPSMADGVFEFVCSDGGRLVRFT
jgi:hypothetical protein